MGNGRDMASPTTIAHPMTPNLWQRLKQIFDAAMDRPASAIPEVAPVITATFPSNLPKTTLLLARLETVECRFAH
jgi:hypothetical protein